MTEQDNGKTDLIQIRINPHARKALPEVARVLGFTFQNPGPRRGEGNVSALLTALIEGAIDVAKYSQDWSDED